MVDPSRDPDNVFDVGETRHVGYNTNGEATPWKEAYVKIKAAFRQKALKLLKGPKLSCFLCVALHVGEGGTAHPSIDTIMRETGYSRSIVCNALTELEKLGFIEKGRRKHSSTLYQVKGYVWYGSEPSPTLLGEAQSSKSELSRSQSSETKRSESKRLESEPKDKPFSKDKPLIERKLSNSLPPNVSPETIRQAEPPPDVAPETAPSCRADPLMQELERQTVSAKANYAVPPQAGGDDVLIDTAITLLCSGHAPKKKSGTYKDMANVIGEIHTAFGLVEQERPLDVVKLAVELFIAEKPQMTVYKYPSFAANYYQYLSRAANGEKGEQHGNAHQRNREGIAKGAVPRRVATADEARAILGDRYGGK